MPGIQNGAQPTQAQNATTSNGGTSKVPKLDASSFFYLEDETYVQAPSQKFGIVSSNEFRTTSTVTLTSKKIISICSGQVFLQPYEGDTTKVNLILKPYKQPVAGLAVKYFIYRGLPLGQFMDSTGKVLTTGSGLVNHIQTEFNNFYNQDTSLQPKPDLLGKFIGYPDAAAPAGQSQEVTDLIDEYFYKISQTFTDETGDITNAKRAFEMPMIPAGCELTTAISGDIGLDVVLNYGDYYIENDTNPFKLDLAFARAPFGVINVSTITDAYQKKLMREAVSLFIDPAAYYGLHANGGKIFKVGLTSPIETSAAIYTLIANFATKNSVYLYVQSNRQRSYNFYNKYVLSDTNANNIKIGDTEATLQETTFETDSWPLKVYSATPATGSDKLSIALQFTTDKGVNTSLFGLLANLESVNSEGFVGAKDLVQEPDTNGAISNFTKTILLSTPATSNVVMASIIQLIYLGKSIILSRPALDGGDPILFTTKYRDDVFYLINATSFLKADKIYHVHSYKPSLYNQGEIDTKRNRVASFTQRTQNTIAINDTQNITLFTYLSIAESGESSHSIVSSNQSANSEATGYSVQSVAEIYTLPNLPSNESIELKPFTDSGQTKNGVILKTKEGSLPTTMVLGISELQNNEILNLIANVNNPFISLRNLLNNEDDFFISTENVKYKSYVIEVVGEDQLGELKVFSPAIDIKVHSLDGLVFTSFEYSEHISQFSSETLFTILKI